MGLVKRRVEDGRGRRHRSYTLRWSYSSTGCPVRPEERNSFRGAFEDRRGPSFRRRYLRLQQAKTCSHRLRWCRQGWSPRMEAALDDRGGLFATGVHVKSAKRLAIAALFLEMLHTRQPFRRQGTHAWRELSPQVDDVASSDHLSTQVVAAYCFCAGSRSGPYSPKYSCALCQSIVSQP